MEKLNIIAIEKPKSQVTEAYRTLRTNIQFSSFDRKVQSIVVTSSGPGEGKSTTASNLAVVMSESGGKTILIDCDQRRPRQHKIFAVSNESGISDLLIGKVKFEEAVQKTSVENLDILTSGTKPPNPAELLSSSKMKNFVDDLKSRYEYIIIDTPPVIAVTDAQLIASHADGTVLVVASSQAEKEAVVKSKELLEKVNAKILGVVLNKLELKEKGYYGYYYYDDTDSMKGKKRRK